MAHAPDAVTVRIRINVQERDTRPKNVNFVNAEKLAKTMKILVSALALLTVKKLQMVLNASVLREEVVRGV